MASTRLREALAYAEMGAGIRVERAFRKGEEHSHACKPMTDLKLPAVRALARSTGALLALSAAAALAIILIALTANARAGRALPMLSPLLWTAAGLALLQILCALAIWRVFVVVRERYAGRLEGVTAGLADRVVLAHRDGVPWAMLTATGWEPLTAFLDAVHPEDRHHFPLQSVEGARLIELRLKGDETDWRWHRLRATPLREADGSVREWVGTLNDIHEQTLAGEHRDLVIGELRHRLKNLLTVIDALAKNSRRAGDAEPGVDAFLQRFLGRLHALGAAGDLVLAGNRQSIEAGALMQTTLAPFMGETAPRIHIDGPPLLLSEELGASMGLAMHELATNALKYGALSVPEGRIALVWTVTQGDDGDAVEFDWQEQGGPPPVAPAKSGFGTRMIKYTAARAKSGKVEIDYRPEGLRCRIGFVVPAEPTSN